MALRTLVLIAPRSRDSRASPSTGGPTAAAAAPTKPTEASAAAPTTTDEAKPNETKPQTLLDEVTGEYVSKSELKKRQKQRQKDIQKAERESTRQAPPAKKKNAAEDEAQLNPNVSGLHKQEYF